eukprot:1606665-Alexandrium_andersonii.AAC.1
MSASLVGSEMCIRDSFAPDAGPVCFPRAPRPSGRLGTPRPGLRSGPLRLCLLYTSDAADDM